ncbi:hypothetical protein ONZ45_g17443 [Pleurotus djamor]|nr:hypothetical protein ONZ45_g17443 [Pleurotus djamor]
MVGPLLRYDTVDEQGTWHGAAMIVTADSGSIYEPHPMLTYEWDPNGSTQPQHRVVDPHATVMPTSGSTIHANGNGHRSAAVMTQQVPGHEIYVFGGPGGTFTFWRFLIEIPLSNSEMCISYTINNGQALNFYVPGRFEDMKWAAHSCNGFSAGVNPDDFRGPGFQSGYDPVWVDLLNKHATEHFHVMIGGGDQLYCDSMTREPELQEWVAKMKPEDRKAHPLTEDIATMIDRFLFNHYCQCFRRGAFARANSSIPMINMADDHDLIDGFGSYPEDLQTAPVFKHIGSRGYFFFLLFQCFINVDMDGVDDRPGCHVNRSIIFGAKGPYIPYPSHSFLAYLGPRTYILLLDCRAERKIDQKERNWFVLQLQRFALEKRIRVSFLSGDVHCAAVGIFKTLKSKKEVEIPPSADHRYMVNVITSAIVNTPPPNAVLTMVSSLATKIHKTLHAAETDESMIPLFDVEPHNDMKRSQKFIMGKRNWCSVRLDPNTGDLVTIIHVEKEKGRGQTKG